MSQMTIALIILIATVVLFIWEPWPIIVTAIGASIVFAYTGIITVNDIFTGYNSTTIVLLAGMMVIGSSLFHAGITDLIGEKMVRVTGKSERNIILATLVVSCVLSSVCSNIGVMTAMAPLVTAMCIAAAMLTQVMSNIPTIMLFLPIGISIANAIGVSPYPVAMTITLVGAASYATPFAAPQNMMTVGWTQYKFVDFIKIGLPMLFITYVVVMVIQPIFLPY